MDGILSGSGGVPSPAVGPSVLSPPGDAAILEAVEHRAAGLEADTSTGAATDAVAAAAATTANDALQAALAAFPRPLTEPQRRGFQRHVAQSVRRLSLVHRSSRIILRGLDSLERLVNRLRAEQAVLQAQLDGKEEEVVVAPQQPQASASGSSGAADNTEERAAKAARAEPGSCEEQPQPQPPAAAAAPKQRPAPRRFGGLMRSAVFANMQKVLTTAKKEEERFGNVAQQRDRIAKEARLKLLSEDLAVQEENLAPLLERSDKCRALQEEAEAAAGPLLELLRDMFIQESRYAASFALRAVDAPAGALEEGAASEAPVAYEVPFVPAVYSDDTAELLTQQVAEAVDEYTAYRERIDPILQVLDAERKARQEQRLTELMGVIGAPDSGAGVAAVSPASAALLGGLSGGILDAPGRRVKAGYGISDSDDSDADSLLSAADSADHRVDNSGDDVSGDDGGDHRGVKRARGSGDGAADGDVRDRKLIQSALSALDDFDEMF